MAIALAIALATAPAAAQKEEAERASLSDPSQTSTTLDGGQQLTLESAEEGSSVVGRFGAEFGRESDWIVNLKLKSPLDKGQKEVTLADLDGLAGETVATLSLTKEWVTFRKPRRDQAGNCIRSFDAVCHDHNDAVWRRFLEKRSDWKPIAERDCDTETLNEKGAYWVAKLQEVQRSATLEACREHNDGRNSGRVLMAGRAPEGLETAGLFSDEVCSVDWAEENDRSWDARLKKALKPVCKEYNSAPSSELIPTVRSVDECRFSVLKSKGPRWYMRALRAAEVRLWYLTVEASASDEEFEFVQGGSFEKAEETERNRSVGLSLGLFDRGNFWALAYKDQRIFTGGKPVDVCRPLDETDALRCDSLVLESPSQVDRELAQLDFKRLLTPRLGLNLRLIHDLDNSVWNPHLLVYFLEHKKKGLNGGIDVSYSDADDKLTARVFIGTGFRLLPD